MINRSLSLIAQRTASFCSQVAYLIQWFDGLRSQTFNDFWTPYIDA